MSVKVSFSFVNDDREWISGVEVDEVPAVGARVGLTPVEGAGGYRLDEVVGHRHYFTPEGQEIHVLVGEPRQGPSPRAYGTALTCFQAEIDHGTHPLEAMRVAVAEAYREDGIGR